MPNYEKMISFFSETGKCSYDKTESCLQLYIDYQTRRRKYLECQ